MDILVGSLYVGSFLSPNSSFDSFSYTGGMMGNMNILFGNETKIIRYALRPVCQLQIIVGEFVSQTGVSD